MKDFITYIVRQIVSNPEAIEVEEINEEGVFVYTISAAKEDMGTLIGKEGRNIKSIRNMAKAKAIKDDIRISVNIKEDDQI
ncbi:hypothetical protein A2380_01770 [candidate division WWE3 bacterium RIFOXYB1_FULL_43_24]|uniref:RNA-binding protein KhpA n=1 Tax=candidate division WWE3 bacterium GW2011_GWB1_42_6 TaxID=1619115 RepID=A0A0G1B001_UNCKA|nr:MAG: hypothetical protein UU92_C0002G0029 [candidate division WWE3 bacterium GW2011_GWA1_42_12]KKS40394.1 MAG: hypothetical protein UV03_C0007G0029 [candidate division WWE3 bacterium GW2011_GWE1_42_16]KKS66597.1 MAG: hypothetical protein UV35_C0011G0030 [candidate division WWE3 bacterium GW2011_GWB1_42_6]OGC59081.1 MAG: hypothetical protein A2212_02225 [candidate division WWE3 bacterium RIFOXYA1_FULL_42_9]OGC69649.1 MAG: hypothetical protein A2380_01770 [candidate division WWE3 bacterium RIF